MTETDETSEDPSADPASGSTAGSEAPAWARSAKVAVLVLALALVAVLVAAVLLWRDDSSAESAAGSDAAALADAGTQAEKAARAAVTRMTTYDYRTVDEDFTWVDDAGTEKFQQYFASSRADAKPLIRRLQVIATGTVVDAAPRVDDVDHVHVLLFVDQEIRVADKQDTKVDQPRVTMEMVLAGRRLAGRRRAGQRPAHQRLAAFASRGSAAATGRPPCCDGEPMRLSPTRARRAPAPGRPRAAGRPRPGRRWRRTRCG